MGLGRKFEVEKTKSGRRGHTRILDCGKTPVMNIRAIDSSICAGIDVDFSNR